MSCTAVKTHLHGDRIYTPRERQRSAGDGFRPDSMCHNLENQANKQGTSPESSDAAALRWVRPQSISSQQCRRQQQITPRGTTMLPRSAPFANELHFKTTCPGPDSDVLDFIKDVKHPSPSTIRDVCPNCFCPPIPWSRWHLRWRLNELSRHRNINNSRN